MIRKSAFLIFASILSLAVFSATATADSSLEPVSTKAGGITFSVDPRIELLSIVQYLGSYREKMFTPVLTKFDYQYTRDVEKYFGPYKSHRAVTLFDRMWPKGYFLAAPVETMIYSSMPPDIRLSRSASEFVKMRAGGEQNARDFVTALAEFARDSHFSEFYIAHRPDYERAVSSTASVADKNELLSVLESYYGMKQGSYTVVTSMLGHYGGFGPRIERKPGVYDVFSIGGPASLKDGQPVFFGDTEGLRAIVWHEFSHSFINPMTERHRDSVMSYAMVIESTLVNPKGNVKFENAEQRQEAIEESINEHIIRAVGLRLLTRNVSDTAAQDARNRELKRGYLYVDALSAKLEQYEKQRDKYPTIESFYPELLKAFGTKPAPATGQRLAVREISL